MYNAMAASSLPSFCGLSKPLPECKVPRFLQVRAQSFGDEGNWPNIVDSNLSVLRERIEKVRMEERLQRCYRGGGGWYYPSGYDNNIKKEAILSESLEVVSLVCRSFGLVFLSATLCIYLVSFVVHFSQ